MNIPRDWRACKCCEGVDKEGYAYSYTHLSDVERKRLQRQNSHQTLKTTQARNKALTIKILGKSDIKAPEQNPYRMAKTIMPPALCMPNQANIKTPVPNDMGMIML